MRAALRQSSLVPNRSSRAPVEGLSSQRCPRSCLATAGGRRTCIGDLPPITQKVYCHVPKPRSHVIASPFPLPSTREETFGRFHFGEQQQKNAYGIRDTSPRNWSSPPSVCALPRVQPSDQVSKAVLDLNSLARVTEFHLVTGRFHRRLHSWHSNHVVFLAFNRSRTGLIVQLKSFRRVAALNCTASHLHHRFQRTYYISFKKKNCKKKGAR